VAGAVAGNDDLVLAANGDKGRAALSSELQNDPALKALANAAPGNLDRLQGAYADAARATDEQRYVPAQESLNALRDAFVGKSIKVEGGAYTLQGPNPLQADGSSRGFLSKDAAAADGILRVCLIQRFCRAGHRQRGWHLSVSDRKPS
jgi:hypothetical protein